MSKLGKDIIGTSRLPSFFRVSNADHISIFPPENRKGDGLRTWVRSLSGFQKEALISSAKTGQTWRLVSDEGPYLNGHDAAPCPLAFLSVGMVASFMNEILALAEKQDVNIRKLKLIQNNYYTMRGSMPKRTMIGGAEDIELQVDIDCDLDDKSLNEFLINATFASPLNGLMRGQLESLFKLGKNGKELSTCKAAELNGNLLWDPGGRFSEVIPIKATETLVRPVGLTPKKEVLKGTTSGGSSLSDEQDRRLNIGAVAEMREDGIKEIQQMQYSPYGTSFCLLSSEDGRAPDANTLISAGIGFCFGGLCVLDTARTGIDIAGVVSFHGIFNKPGNTDGNKVETKVLVLHGNDDPMVPHSDVNGLANELTEAEADWQIHAYGSTSHAFTNKEANSPEMGMAYNPDADRRSWKSMTDFLKEVIG